MVEVQVEEQFAKKETPWGVVDKPLNQHIVRVKNDKGQFVHCGYVGVNAFLPLAGFPAELVNPVADECAKQLNREIERVAPPLSLKQIADMKREMASS